MIPYFEEIKQELSFCCAVFHISVTNILQYFLLNECTYMQNLILATSIFFYVTHDKQWRVYQISQVFIFHTSFTQEYLSNYLFVIPHTKSLTGLLRTDLMISPNLSGKSFQSQENTVCFTLYKQHQHMVTFHQ